MIKSISILELDASFQIRVETSEEKVSQYAEYFLEHNDWGEFPPLDVVQIDGKCFIADGIHRFNAAKRAGFEEVPCNVATGTRWELFKRSIVKNGIQGLGMSRADLEHFRRMLLEEFPEKTLEELGEMGQCSPQTIMRLKKKMIEEGHVFPETIIGADGKEYPTSYKKPAFPNGKAQNPPKSNAGEESTNPFDNSTVPNVTVESDMHFCANGCGAPIWDEMKNHPDSTYCEEGGKWFCSPTCLDEYQVKKRVEEAESLTGIKDELPPLPSAAVRPAHPEPEPEPEYENENAENKPFVVSFEVKLTGKNYKCKAFSEESAFHEAVCETFVKHFGDYEIVKRVVTKGNRNNS